MARALPQLDQVLQDGKLPLQDHTAHSVYGLVLEAEAQAECTRSAVGLLGARTIGYMLIDPLSDTARNVVMSELLACASREDSVQAVYELGTGYACILLGLFKGHRRTRPPTPEHSSRLSFEDIQEQYRALVQVSPRDHATTRKQALLRDGFRCMLTGTLGIGFQIVSDEPMEPLECYNIFPEVLGTLALQQDDDKKQPIAAAWALLERFGLREVLDELAGKKIHRLENAMTLTANSCARFADMRLWLEPVMGSDNWYHVRVAAPRTHRKYRVPYNIQLVAQECLPLPDPEYLRIHATCCRIVHMSGAAEYYDRVVHTEQEAGVLAEDGSSAEMLAFILRTVQPMP